jgi:hypothetical protein
MPAFRRTDAQRAGATAVGILIPPGATTFVILRPRGLEWDLLPAHWNGDAEARPVFSRFGREEAALVARRLQQSLEDAVAAGSNPVETFGRPASKEYQVWLRTEEYVWIVCRRRPGQAYEPLVFASQVEAENAGRHLGRFFHPAADANQEYYFNTQHFA